MWARRGCVLLASTIVLGCGAGASSFDGAEAVAPEPSDAAPPSKGSGGSAAGTGSGGGTAPAGGGAGGATPDLPSGGGGGGSGGGSAGLSPKAPTPGVVKCGGFTCEAGQNQFCCIDGPTLKQCRPLGCLPTDVPLTCDGPEDCAAGKLCVMDLFDGRRPTYCRPEPLNAEVIVCNSGADCPAQAPHCCQFIDRRSCSAAPSPVAEGCD